MRERFLSHRLHPDYDAVLDAACDAWRKLTPERLQSLTAFPWLPQISSQTRRYHYLLRPLHGRMHQTALTTRMAPSRSITRTAISPRLRLICTLTRSAPNERL